MTLIENNKNAKNVNKRYTKKMVCDLFKTHIILLVGESGCGKNYLCDELHKRFGLSILPSYTTRPKRFENEQGHIFVTEEEFRQVPAKEIVAYNKFCGNHYWATRSQVDTSDIYIVDKPGITRFKALYVGPKIPIVVYLDVPQELRKARMEKRGDKLEDINERLLNDEKVFKDVDKMSDIILYPCSPSINNNIKKLVDVFVDLVLSFPVKTI